MAEPCSSNNWPNVVTWLLVSAGWLVVHQATLSRERRREKREESLKFCAELRSIENLAIDFHTNAQHDALKATDLRQEVERLSRKLQRVPLSDLNIDHKLIIQFRQSVTRKNFDPHNFAPQTPESDILYGIRDAVTDLVESIEVNRERYWS